MKIKYTYVSIKKGDKVKFGNYTPDLANYNLTKERHEKLKDLIFTVAKIDTNWHGKQATECFNREEGSWCLPKIAWKLCE